MGKKLSPYVLQYTFHQLDCTFIFLALPSRLPVVIVVQGVSGGKWEFPLTLVGSEPQVDDVIDVDAARLGETAAVGFRLTSTTRWAQAGGFVLAACAKMSQDVSRKD